MSCGRRHRTMSTAVPAPQSQRALSIGQLGMQPEGKRGNQLRPGSGSGSGSRLPWSRWFVWCKAPSPSPASCPRVACLPSTCLSDARLPVRRFFFPRFPISCHPSSWLPSCRSAFCSPASFVLAACPSGACFPAPPPSLAAGCSTDSSCFSYLATAALRTCVLKKPPLVFSMTCW